MSRFAPPKPGPSTVRHIVALLGALLWLAAPLAPAAHANQYRAFVCSTPDGAGLPLVPAQTPAWAFQDFSGVVEQCAAGGPIQLFVGRYPASAPYNQGELVRWDIVSPVPIAATWITRTLATTKDSRDFDGTPEYIEQARTSASGAVTSVLVHCLAVDNCQLGNDRLGADPSNTLGWTMPDMRAKVLEFSLRCGGQPWGTCATGGDVRMLSKIHRIELALDDPEPPYSTQLDGSLLASGDLSGVRDLTFTARDSDRGGGVLATAVLVDGKEVDRVRPEGAGIDCVDAGFRSVPNYRKLQPCPFEGKVRVSLDSRNYSDGKHMVSIKLLDAALNESTVLAKEVKFENVPPPANGEKPTIGGPAGEPRPKDVLSVALGKWSGAGIKFSYEWQRSAEAGGWTPVKDGAGPTYIVHKDDIGHLLRVVVTASNVEGETSVATSPTAVVTTGETIVTSGASAPPAETPRTGGDPSTAQLVVDREQRTVEVNYGAKIVVTGRLVDADGQPIANATVDVFEQLVLTAAPWDKIGSVTTDSQGGYVFRPKTTASRRLRFAFSDRRDAADYRATREVLVSVRAGMSISAKRKVLRPRGVIRLRGRVTVDNLPKTGTWVEVQVLDAGVWRTVATRKTSSKGLWTFKHRLRQSSGIAFRFRSRLRVVGDVASIETASQPLRIRVR